MKAITLSAMKARDSTTKQAENAEPRATLAVSQHEPITPAPLGADAAQESSQPEQPPIPRTVSALSRAIEGCVRQIERTDQKITAAKRRQESSEILALSRQKANLVARKGILERLRDGQVRSTAL